MEIDGRLGTHVLHAALPVSAQEIVTEAVMSMVDDCLQSRLKLRPPSRVKLDFENRELYSLSVVLAGPSDSS
jgi:hypothetical protein